MPASIPFALLFLSLIASISSLDPPEYLYPSLPPFLPSSDLSSCSIAILQHDFSGTRALPPASAAISPFVTCPPPWSLVLLHLSASCVGSQYGRIASVWIEGVEILRTSTAQPTESGAYWHVRKDVTRYASLLRRPSGFVNVSMALMDSFIGDAHTVIYNASLSIEFYPDPDPDDADSTRLYGEDEKVSMIPLLDDPADVVIPVSSKNFSSGFWFKFRNHSDAHFGRVAIPPNTFRAVLEVYASFHSDDEFWYWNPPDEYIEKNNLKIQGGGGAFREVFATVDGLFAGTVLPFPVIFAGGINPLFWAPVVSIGAFDLPSYDLDLTPFLELLLDGEEHSFGFGVTDGISFWLIDANLHLWLDLGSEAVTAKLVHHETPPLSIARTNKFLHLNGTFKIDAERKVAFSGWVSSSMGNLTTDVNQKLKFKSSVEYQNDGNFKAVHLKTKAKTEVKIKKSREVILSRTSHKFKYPLLILSETLPGINNTFTSITNISHTLYEEASVFMLDKLISLKILTDKQDASGWMRAQNRSVLSGSAATKQIYQYRDNGNCYNRNLEAEDGVLLGDTSDNACSLSY